MKKLYVIVRPPGKSFIHAINDWYKKIPSGKKVSIDWEKALWQHTQYINCLKKIGVKVIKLPLNEKFPDSCFTQDPVIVCENEALETIQFAKSRQGEGKTINKKLRALGFNIYRMSTGFCDGGDVLIAHDLKKVLVGISQRTNVLGYKRIKKLFENNNYQVNSIPVTKCLHLMTGITYLNKNTFLISNLIDESINKIMDLSSKPRLIKVPTEENYAVNILAIDNLVIMPSGYQITKKMVEKFGYEVVCLNMSEFEKADGGITCLSLLFKI